MMFQKDNVIPFRRECKCALALVAEFESTKADCWAELVKLQGNHHELFCPQWSTRDLLIRGQHPAQRGLSKNDLVPDSVIAKTEFTVLVQQLGGIRAAAKYFDVSVSTMRRWLRKLPEGLERYMLK